MYVYLEVAENCKMSVVTTYNWSSRVHGLRRATILRISPYFPHVDMKAIAKLNHPLLSEIACV